MPKSLTTKNPVSERMQAIRTTLWVILFLNLFVAAAKYIYGTMQGLASMQADGIHSFFDSAGNVIGLIGIAMASRPADEGHPYGHSKFETYGSLCIGVLLVFAAFEVGTSAIEKLLTQNYVSEVDTLSFVVMIGTLLVNIFVAYYERRQGIRLKSEILTADSSHTLSDVLVSAAVIVGLIFVALGFPIADPIMALVVTVAIAATAYDVFKHALETLSDHARIPEEDIQKAVLSIPGVVDAHKIRTRGTEGEIYADLHVLVVPSMTVLEAHDLSNTIEDALQNQFDSMVDVLVHIEPNDGHQE